jgi:nitroreductase
MLALLAAVGFSALPDIKLNAPDTKRGAPYGEALNKRHSERSFATTALSLKDLSDLLWTVGGINRQSTGYLVNPTATNSQDISIYAVLPQGIYSYDKKAHTLRNVVEGDLREEVATTAQPTIAGAPVIILIVSDTAAFSGLTDAERHRWSALDSGVVAQSALLFAAANGFVAVPRAQMNTAKLAQVLKLKSSQVLELNVPIGHAP